MESDALRAPFRKRSLVRAALQLLKFTEAGTRRLVNIGHMLTGSFVNAGIMLVSVVIAARGLGPELFGSMVLVLALASTTERLIRFETWQPLVKFVADEELAGSPARMARLYAFGLMLDVSTAALATFITILAAFLSERMFGWHSIPVEAAAIYGVAMLCNIIGAPGAALRLSGRFRVIAYVQVPANIGRAILAAFCLWSDSGLLGYILAWTAAEVGYRLATLWLGLRALKDRGIPSPFAVRWTGLFREFPGFLSFAWSINLSTMLRTLTTDADELVVGAVAGQSSASMYNLAKRVAKFSQEVGTQVQTVLYPEIARMWSSRNSEVFRSTVFRTQRILSVIALLVIAVAWLIGPWLIRVGPGESYMPAYPILTVQVIAVLFTMHSAPGRSAILSMGRHRAILGISAIGTLVFYAVMVPGVLSYGAIGAAAAHVVLAFITAAMIDFLWIRHSNPQLIASTAPGTTQPE